MWILFIIVVVLIIVGAIISGNKNIAAFETKTGLKTSDLQNAGTYVSGHPNIDKPFKQTRLLLDDKLVKIFTSDHTGFVELGAVEKELITNVVIEDASTLQKRVTVGRLLLTGIFAFAWKKKDKIESAYFIIEWKKGMFEHETIFEFEDKGAVSFANTLRNRFIQYLNNESPADIFNNEILQLEKSGQNIKAVEKLYTVKKLTISDAQVYIKDLLEKENIN